MPELPEVTTIQKQLQKKIRNKIIKKVIFKDKRVLKGTSPNKFRLAVEGTTIKDILRRGKVLILSLREDLYLVFHLRISGWLRVSSKHEDFSRVIFELSDGRSFQFCDRRVLGEIRLINDWRALPIIKTMGPEPFDIDRHEFVRLCRGKKTKIKPLLMDQRFLAGVGNIYAQEALFYAGVHPHTPTHTIPKKTLEKIYASLIGVLKEAIRQQGSSIDSYRHINGEEGNFVSFLKVYQRENEPCCVCNTQVEREVIGGRGTYFCPRCQK